MDKQKLIAFENKIADLFNKAKIRAPIHLYSNNEEQMIKIFKKIKKNDWVFCSWRSHYQCLLKGVSEKTLTKEIVAGKSISLCFPEHKIYSSAIVGGVLPIATGVAFSNKIQKIKSKVFCFVGETCPGKSRCVRLNVTSIFFVWEAYVLNKKSMCAVAAQRS